MKSIFTFVAALTMAAPALACDVKATYEPWEPYQFVDGGKLKGIDIEIAEAVAEKAGCKITFTELPWSRQLKNVESGETDLVLAASKTPEREAFAFYKDGYRQEAVALFIRKGEADKLKVATHADITKFAGTVGTTKENSYGDTMDGIIKANAARFEEVAAEDLNAKKLDAKRIDGFLSDKYAGASIVAKAGLAAKIQEHPFAVNSSPVFFIFSKKIKDGSLPEKWNKAMLELKASGKIDAILKKYAL